MIVQQVADHENSRMLSSQLDELLAFISAKRQRLFDKYILPSEDCFLCQFKMLRCRRSDGDGLNFGNRQQFVESPCSCDRITLLHLLDARSLHVTNGSQSSQFGEVRR